MKNMFDLISDTTVVLVKNGTFKDAPLYTRNFEGYHGIYAKTGSSYVRLFKNGITSAPKLTWQQLSTVERYDTDVHGRLILV
jgi:hypothetical protein